MAQTWPVTLPSYFLKGSYREAPIDQTIRSATDLGRPRVRRRFTRDIIVVSGIMRMTQSQVDSLKTFYYTTCVGGTDSILITNPFNAIQSEYNFLSPPEFVHIGHDRYDVSLSLELLP